jgi:DinB superfamily
MSMSQRPAANEYAGFFANYVALVPEADILPAMEKQLEEMLALLRHVPKGQEDVCHAPYTWTIKEVVGHLNDAERVFAYRALRFAREDATPLATFEENPYVTAGKFNRLALADLASEFEHLRRANIFLFRGMPAEAWSRVGIASGAPVTVRALAYVIVGHVRHHGAILRKRIGIV